MSAHQVTTCDRCNSEGNLTSHTGRGYVHYGPNDAVQDFGWKRVRGEGHICPECQDEERHEEMPSNEAIVRSRSTEER